MIRFALLLTLTACGTRQAPPSTPDATPVAEPAASPAALPTGTRTPAPTDMATPDAPPSVTAIAGLLSAHDTADLPQRSTLDAHEDAVSSLAWIANHGDPMAVRGRAMQILGQYDDELAVQTQRDAVSDLQAHAIVVASAIRGMTDRGFADDEESYELVLKRDAETDPRIAAAVVLAKESMSVE